MNKKIVMVSLAVGLLLCGCQSKAAKENPQEQQAASMAETVNEETESEAVVSDMGKLTADATAEDLIKAFQSDYRRAAEILGVSDHHDDLDYNATDSESIRMQLNDKVLLLIDSTDSMKRVWYTGYPGDDEWLAREIQLVLMAADPALSIEEAKTYTDELIAEAWENRNNMPSAIQKYLPGGVYYSLALSDQKLVSFQIAY